MNRLATWASNNEPILSAIAVIFAALFVVSTLST